MEKFTKTFFTIYICSIHGCLLGNKNQFLYPHINKFICLFENIFIWIASEITPYFRNYTVCAVFVTTFSNFQIFIISTCCYNSLIISCNKPVFRIDYIVSLSIKDRENYFSNLII